MNYNNANVEGTDRRRGFVFVCGGGTLVSSLQQGARRTYRSSSPAFHILPAFTGMSTDNKVSLFLD